MRARRRAVALALALVASLVAASARAVEMSFAGSMQLQINVLPPLAVDADGIAEVAIGTDASITRIDLPANAFVTQTFVVPVTDPGAAPIRGVALRDFANDVGVFERDGSGRLGGSMPLAGDLRVCLFGPCGAALANIDVPLSVLGRTATTSVDAAVALTVRGAPWTTRTVAIGTNTWAGSDAGLDLNLVTPIFVSTNIGASAVVPVHGRLTLALDAPENACANGIDDDADGTVDHPEDPGCESAEDTSERSPSAPCDNGVDDDGDRRIDNNDPGCAHPGDDSERSSALACDDGLDNDADGFADLEDRGCASPSDPSERGNFDCENDLDDDRDGLVDTADPGCAYASDDDERGPGRACDDGLDDDRDGVADFPDDTGCASVEDPSERSATLPCDDGLDRDGDGRSDYSLESWNTDPGCASRTDPSERSALLACDDGLDNDRDGGSDVPEDRGCASPWDESELASTYACDNGLDDDEDGAIDSQQDPGCSDPLDPREAVDFLDGGYWGIGAAESQPDDVWVDDGPGHFTALDVQAGGAIGGDLTASGASLVRLRGGTIAGSLVAEEFAEVEILRGAIEGGVEARDTSTVTIFGSGFDRPLGVVTATSGTLAGFLADGTPFVWSFVRDAGAAIVLAPEPGAAAVALVALAALRSLRRRSTR